MVGGRSAFGPASRILTGFLKLVILCILDHDRFSLTFFSLPRGLLRLPLAGKARKSIFYFPKLRMLNVFYTAYDVDTVFVFINTKM